MRKRTTGHAAAQVAACPKCYAVRPETDIVCRACHGGGASNHPETLIPLFCVGCKGPLTRWDRDPEKLECVPCRRLIAPEAAVKQVLEPPSAPWKCPRCEWEAPPKTTLRAFTRHKCIADMLNRKAQDRLACAMEGQGADGKKPEFSPPEEPSDIIAGGKDICKALGIQYSPAAWKRLYRAGKAHKLPIRFHRDPNGRPLPPTAPKAELIRRYNEMQRRRHDR